MNLPRRKKKRARRGPWKLVPAGSVTVKIYASKRGRRARAPYTVTWRELREGSDRSHRQRVMRSDPFVAVSFAQDKAAELANGQAWRARLTQADWASYQRALQILAPTGQPLELACSIYTESVQILPKEVSLVEAARFYMQHRPAGVAPLNIPKLVDLLLEKKRLHGKGEKWLGTLEQQLRRFAAAFDCALHAIRKHQLTAWLDALRPTGRIAPVSSAGPIGLRTRKNYRDAIRELVRFAKDQGQLAKAWDELPEKIDPPPVEVEVYKPDELVKLLAHTRPNMIPFTVLAAFAGIRHEEMTGTKALLEWRDINLDKAVIKIRKTVGKTKKLRLIDLHPNLVAWLRPHAVPSGRVCDLDHTANALVRAKHRAGIPAGPGQLTNALRSSFISYRLAETNDIGLVAREAGNSPNIIRENYLELVSKTEGKRWFDIWPADVLQLRPTQPDVVQLNFAGL